MPVNNREENLEERIERIRKRDEEIEKKYREAEADRLAALQANAMVNTTAPKEEDWPKAHKYDKLDFTYDVKEPNGDENVTKKDDNRVTRNFKKFPEGQGPPADPTYNFLADAERDGAMKQTKSGSDSTDWRSSCTGGNLNRRNSNNSGSFKRGNAPNKGKNNPKFPPRNGDAKNEREIVRNRRDKDNEKVSDEVPKNNAKDSNETEFRFLKGNDQKTSPIHTNTNAFKEIDMNPMTKPQVNNTLPHKMSELSIEKRGNITVSVTQDGEVKSVKLEAARAIGTGRVGNGMSLRQNPPPQFQASNDAPLRSPQTIPNMIPMVTVPQPLPQMQASAMPKRSSVQDRLNRIRQNADNTQMAINL